MNSKKLILPAIISTILGTSGAILNNSDDAAPKAENKDFVKLFNLEQALNEKGILELNDSDYVNIAKVYVNADFISKNPQTIIDIGSVTNPEYDKTYFNEFSDDVKVSVDSLRYTKFIYDFNNKRIRNIISMYIHFPYETYKKFPTEVIEILQATVDKPIHYESAYSHIIAENPDRIISELDELSFHRKKIILDLLPEIISEHPDTLKRFIQLSSTGTESVAIALEHISQNKMLFRERPEDYLKIAENSQEYSMILLQKVNDGSTLTEALNKSIAAGKGVLSHTLLDYLVLTGISSMSDSPYLHTTTLKRLTHEKLDTIQVKYAKTLRQIGDISKTPFEFGDFAMKMMIKGDIEKIKVMLKKADYVMNSYGGAKKTASLNDFLIRSISTEYIDSLMSLKTSSGTTLFSLDDALDYASAEGKYDMALDMHKKYGAEGKQILLFQTLGAGDSLALFKDTEKPNCLMLYPSEDHNNAFKIDDNRKMFNEIIQKYDVLIKAVKNEDQIYGFMDSIPNIELLIMGGHGYKKVMQLDNASNESIGESLMQTNRIDTGDYEIFEHAKNLSPDAKIFLYSCSNGKGREKEDNLANFIAKMTDRTVYSLSRPGNLCDVKIDNVYPFEISNTHNNRDVLYIAEPDKIKK